MVALEIWGGERAVSAAHGLGSRERKRRETHERLYAVALAEFERVGFEAARIEHICNLAELTRPTFYAHFQSKEGVLEELQLRLFASMLEVLQDRLADTSSLGDLTDALVDGVFDAASASPEGLRRESSAYACRHQSQPEWADTALFRAVEQRFAAARDRGQIGNQKPGDLTHWIMVTLNGFYASYADHLEEGRRGARAILRGFVAGLLASPGRD